jgi:hypothetical protein
MKKLIVVVSLLSISLFLIYKLVNWYSYSQKFNKAAWAVRDEGFIYYNRKYMLNDLIENHQIRGLTYKQLVESIGEPRMDSGSYEAYYNIELDYGWDIDPVYSKDLVIQLNRDSVVTGFDFKEWKN